MTVNFHQSAFFVEIKQKWIWPLKNRHSIYLEYLEDKIKDRQTQRTDSQRIVVMDWIYANPKTRSETEKTEPENLKLPKPKPY